MRDYSDRLEARLGVNMAARRLIHVTPQSIRLPPMMRPTVSTSSKNKMPPITAKMGESKLKGVTRFTGYRSNKK